MRKATDGLGVKALGRTSRSPAKGTVAMTGHYFIIGALLTLGSMAMIAWLRQVWLFARGWRFANPEEVRLSGTCVMWLRLSGAVGVVMRLALAAYPFR